MTQVAVIRVLEQFDSYDCSKMFRKVCGVTADDVQLDAALDAAHVRSFGPPVGQQTKDELCDGSVLLIRKLNKVAKTQCRMV